jgi:hypothetical protein
MAAYIHGIAANANPSVRFQSDRGPSRLGSRLAWPLCGLALAGAVAVIVLDVLDRMRIHSFHDSQPAGIVLPVSFSLLGAIIVSRQPGNRIGWIYLLIGVLMPWPPLGALYFERSVIAGGLPGARWAAWMNDWAVPPVFPAGLSLFAFLLFPSGRLPSPRWRPVAWSAVVLTSIGLVLTWVDPSPISVSSDLPQVANPTGVAALGSVAGNDVGGAWWLIALALLAATIGSLVVRGRSAAPHERQQVKLLAYAAALTIGILIVLEIIGIAGVATSSSWGDAVIVLGFGVAVPVACGIAILKHGLYEIDRLISRTLSYAILTGLLVGVFVGVVALATQILPFSSPVAVAASTLAAAGLFNPLRLRVQRLVDRRFNRARYDAEATVSAFTLRLRDAVDLDTVRGELLHAVDRAVEPAQASLWIRPPAPHTRG